MGNGQGGAVVVGVEPPEDATDGICRSHHIRHEDVLCNKRREQSYLLSYDHIDELFLVNRKNAKLRMLLFFYVTTAIVKEL